MTKRKISSITGKSRISDLPDIFQLLTRGYFLGRDLPMMAIFYLEKILQSTFTTIKLVNVRNTHDRDVNRYYRWTVIFRQ